MKKTSGVPPAAVFRVLSAFLALLLVAGTVISEGGCGNSGDTRLRGINALPNSPSVDFLIDTLTLAAGVSYGAASPYVAINPGARTIQANTAGTATSLITSAITVSKQTDTTYVALGPSDSLTTLVLTDDNSAPPDGYAKLRMIHAAPGLGTTDVYLTDPNADLNTVTPTFSALPYSGVSTYFSAGAGNYRLRVTTGGTKTVIVDSGSLTLGAGEIRTGLILIPASGTGYTLTLLGDAN
jgi:Domain of unknown function (DUF4397)